MVMAATSTARAASLVSQTPRALDVDQAGNLYVADLGNNTIRKNHTDRRERSHKLGGHHHRRLGRQQWLHRCRGALPHSSIRPTMSPWTARATSMWRTLKTTRSAKITPTVVSGVTNWVVTTLAGSAGNQGRVDGTGSAAQFDSPFSIAVDSARATSTPRMVRSGRSPPAGVVTTIAGITEGPQGSQDGTAALHYSIPPQGIAVDGTGNLYVTDTMNNTIRKITPTVVSGVTNWNVTTIAGAAGSVGWADGIGRAVQFNYPVGIAADSSGDVYVADTENNTIREGVPVVAAPAITAQPVSETVTRGFNASFTATVNGTPVPSIQWPGEHRRWEHVDESAGDWPLFGSDHRNVDHHRSCFVDERLPIPVCGHQQYQHGHKRGGHLDGQPDRSAGGLDLDEI